MHRRRRCRLIRRLEERGGGRCAVTGRVRDRARVRRFQLDAGGEPATAGGMQPACGAVESVRNVYLGDSGLNARMRKAIKSINQWLADNRPRDVAAVAVQPRPWARRPQVETEVECRDT